MLFVAATRTEGFLFLGLIKPIVPFIALILMLAGCQALTGETVGESVDDTGITTRDKAGLAADKGSSLTR